MNFFLWESKIFENSVSVLKKGFGKREKKNLQFKVEDNMIFTIKKKKKLLAISG